MRSLPILILAALLTACGATQEDPVSADAGTSADSGEEAPLSSLTMQASVKYVESPFSDEDDFSAFVQLSDDDGIVEDATVTINGTPLTYDPLFQYNARLDQAAALGIAPGQQIKVKVERGDETLEMETVCPTPEIVSPSAGTAYLPGTAVEIQFQPAVVNSDGAGYSILESTRYVAGSNKGVAVTGSVDSVEEVDWLEVGDTSGTVDMPGPWIDSEPDYAVSLEYLGEDVMLPSRRWASRLFCMVVRRIHLKGIEP